MRQSQRECNTPEFFDEVFNRGEVLFLSLNTEGFPYGVPVNFVFLEGRLYFHCALEGAKLDLIRRDGRVGFVVAADIVIAREKSTTYYKSVCGTGRASLVENMDEKRHAIDALAERYGASCPRPTPDGALRHVAVVRIDIEAMTGKRHVPNH